jgi:membrane-associated phospholipid phosphatase
MEVVRQAPRQATRATALVAVVAAFAALAALVVAGRLNGVDRYAIDRWMPGLSPGPSDLKPVSSAGLYRPFSWHIPWWQKLVDLWTYPASVLISVLVFALGAWVLAGRGRPRAALIWLAAWLAANGIEVVGKGTLERPALYGRDEQGARWHIAPFDTSFPSGHATRSVLVAGLIVYLWPRATWPLVVWAALALPALVVSAAHTPTDVAGGALIGLLAILAVRAALESRFARA